jgi:type II secretory ATPase GspE/PulE/Tfp pilus assembly ATPase PilB-like protein
MNESQEKTMTEIDAKAKEAELYRSMGLLVEALSIYEQILTDAPDLDDAKKESFQASIDKLREEIAELEREDAEKVSAEDISLVKEKLDLEEDPYAVRDSASSFRELGLYDEAISDYEKCFVLELPKEEIIPELCDCYFKVHSAVDVSKKAKALIEEEGLEDPEKALIAFLFGREMETRDHKDLALELYQMSQDHDPENEETRDRVASLSAGMATGSKYDYLLNKGLITTDQLKSALDVSKKSRKSVEAILIDKFNIKKEELGKSLSLYFGCPFRSYEMACTVQPELLANLKRTFLLQEMWMPLAWDKEGIEVLTDDPRNLAKTDSIKTLLGKRIHFSVATKEDLEHYIKDCFDPKKQEELDIDDMTGEDFDLIPDIAFEEDEEVDDDYDELDEASGQVVKLVDQVLVSAYRQNVSDIHIEPSPVTKATLIRFRMDGVCQEYIQVPNTLAKGILSRIKIMSGLDIAERRLPQDGKIKFKRKGIPPFELRVATLPTAGGYEDAVMRILAKAGAMAVEKMGLLERNERILKKIIAQPYGLVLVVGPTGSGKTTSLHAALGHINKPTIKIWTAEDPVEITQAGLRQVEAKPKIGLDFARIMRAFLRADPDVIMIGEMRDEETASTGVEASLTGHLVFSTLHTNSAPETVTRLLDMGLNPLNFSDAFLGVMAQRLARRLCSNCKEAYHPSEEEFEDIIRSYGKEQFKDSGLEYTPETTLYRPKGCDQCSGVGYKGRLGIHEMMEGTLEIKRMIKKSESAEKLFEQAMSEGMITLKQDGIIKAFDGLTDLGEIRRIVAD